MKHVVSQPETLQIHYSSLQISHPKILLTKSILSYNLKTHETRTKNYSEFQLLFNIVSTY